MNGRRQIAASRSLVPNIETRQSFPAAAAAPSLTHVEHFAQHKRQFCSKGETENELCVRRHNEKPQFIAIHGRRTDEAVNGECEDA